MARRGLARRRELKNDRNFQLVVVFRQPGRVVFAQNNITHRACWLGGESNLNRLKRHEVGSHPLTLGLCVTLAYHIATAVLNLDREARFKVPVAARLSRDDERRRDDVIWLRMGCLYKIDFIKRVADILDKVESGGC